MLELRKKMTSKGEMMFKYCRAALLEVFVFTIDFTPYNTATPTVEPVEEKRDSAYNLFGNI